MERDAEWMIDDVGHEQGGCCLAMTLRDLGPLRTVHPGRRAHRRPGRRAGHVAGRATRNQIGTSGGGSGYGYQWWPRHDGTFKAAASTEDLHLDPKRRL